MDATIMAKQRIYRGMSFVNYKNKKTLSLSDIDLVKQDLLNHIYTRLGERRMMSKFGTRIPDMMFEPLDDETLSIIEDDLLTVINYDPRVEFAMNGVFEGGVDITALYDENAIIASADLYYVELDLTETLHIRLEFNT